MYNFEVKPSETVWLFQLLSREIERLEDEHEEWVSCPSFDDETEVAVTVALERIGSRLADVKAMRRRVASVATVNRSLKGV